MRSTVVLLDIGTPGTSREIYQQSSCCEFKSHQRHLHCKCAKEVVISGNENQGTTNTKLDTLTSFK